MHCTHRAPVVLLVIAAGAIVAIGASGYGLLAPRVAGSDGRLWLVRIAGALAAFAGAVTLVVQRQSLPTRTGRDVDPTVGALISAAMIMGAVALISLLSPRVSGDEGRPSTLDTAKVSLEERSRGGMKAPTTPGLSGGFGMASETPGRFGPTQPGEAGEAQRANQGFMRRLRDWIGRVLAVVLLFAIVLASLRALRRRRLDDRSLELPIAPAAAAAGLEASWVEVAYDGPDPRRQITSAYRRLLAALAAAGAPRQPQEAPHEHLHRTLGPLGIRGAPMHRLTELYVRAQFSEHPITDHHRAAAAGALETSLRDLRKTETAAPSASPASARA